VRMWIARHLGLAVTVAVSLTLVAGCSGGSPSSPTPTASSTPAPKATSAREFATAVCSSLTAMSRAIGNPDTASDSVLSAALDEAIRAGDAARVQEAAASMKAELESARQLAAVAGGWQPGAAAAVQLDRLMLAFEAWTEAKRATASQGLAAAETAAQAALIKAGGGEAWGALIGYGAIPAEAREGLVGCRFWEAGAPSVVPSLTPAPVPPMPSG
jgi:hypothetical protein